MADEIERLLVRVEANAEAFERQIKKINRTLHGSQAETRKTLNASQALELAFLLAEQLKAERLSVARARPAV